MASVIGEGIPQSPLPLFVKNTFIDVEDDEFEVDPRRASSEPPSCRHADRESPSPFAFKCAENSIDLPESTASGDVSPRGSVSDDASDDGSQQASTSPASTLNPDAAVWSPTWRPMLFSGAPAPTTTPGPLEYSMSPKQMPSSLPLLELSVLAMIPHYFQKQFQDLAKAAKRQLCASNFVKDVQSFESSGLWGKGLMIAGTASKNLNSDGKRDLLKSVQESLLKSAEESKSVYVMGYSLRPFQPTENGFAAMLGGMEDDDWACWEMLTKGFCSQEGSCCRQHPACMIPIYVEIKDQADA